jgi:hypothetical protein
MRKLNRIERAAKLIGSTKGNRDKDYLDAIINFDNISHVVNYIAVDWLDISIIGRWIENGLVDCAKMRNICRIIELKIERRRLSVIDCSFSIASFILQFLAYTSSCEERNERSYRSYYYKVAFKMITYLNSNLELDGEEFRVCFPSGFCDAQRPMYFFETLVGLNKVIEFS